MLIKCNECGKEISDKATSCPNCGAPVKIEKNAEEIENFSKNLRLNLVSWVR